jgi:hypothetical protein
MPIVEFLSALFIFVTVRCIHKVNSAQIVGNTYCCQRDVINLDTAHQLVGLNCYRYGLRCIKRAILTIDSQTPR